MILLQLLAIIYAMGAGAIVGTSLVPYIAWLWSKIPSQEFMAPDAEDFALANKGFPIAFVWPIALLVWAARKTFVAKEG